jgi:hypothetical protein
MGRLHLGIGDWLGIVSLVLAIPLGIATNLLTPRLVDYLGRRKLVKTTRTKEQELRAYHQVKAFKLGVRDKYPFYMITATLCICFELAAATLALSGLVSLPISPDDFLTVHPARAILGILTGGLFMLGIVFLIIIPSTERRLEHFDEYTAEVRKKWGDDAV